MHSIEIAPHSSALRVAIGWRVYSQCSRGEEGEEGHVPRTPRVCMRRAATDFSYHSSAARAVSIAFDVLAVVLAPPLPPGAEAKAAAAATADVDIGVASGVTAAAGAGTATGLKERVGFVAEGAVAVPLLVRSAAEDKSSCLHCSGVILCSCSGVCK